jgi:polar amino acid transport system permease protein
MLRQFTLGEIFLQLLVATQWTVYLSAVAFVGGGLVGFVFMLLRVMPFGPANWLARAHIQFIQGTPLLMQLFVAFFGMSILGVDVSAWTAASVALTAFTSAFLAEIWRGCVQAIPRPQWEASAALGLGWVQQFRYVIAPQALRLAIPPSVGLSVQVIKGTSLASIIGFVELTRAGTALNNVTFRPFLVFLFVAAIYFGLCYPLTTWSRVLERRLNVARAG